MVAVGSVYITGEVSFRGSFLFGVVVFRGRAFFLGLVLDVSIDKFVFEVWASV